MVVEYKELLETKNAFVKKFSLQVYAAFDESYSMWLAAVESIAQIDALMGLAKGSINMGGNKNTQFCLELSIHSFLLHRTCLQTNANRTRKKRDGIRRIKTSLRYSRVKIYSSFFI